MAKKKVPEEPDSVYFLKLLVFLIVGSIWLRFTEGGDIDTASFSLPIGLVAGLALAQHEHLQIDRKIEYAVLLVSTVLSFYLPVGILL